jgi:hypothetical protein
MAANFQPQGTRGTTISAQASEAGLLLAAESLSGTGVHSRPAKHMLRDGTKALRHAPTAPCDGSYLSEVAFPAMKVVQRLAFDDRAIDGGRTVGARAVCRCG